MALPFQKSDGKRKWQCFVCAREFTEYEEFKSHIIAEHEEGREYILCPLARCGVPIRDLKAHFKAKHPREAVPTKGMMRTIVWKDFTPQGKKKTKKPAFREGTIVSVKMNGREMHYRSGWECEVYECLESLSEVTAYWVEPIRIPYLHEGHMHDYLPDIRVQLGDGTVEIWEIKPSEQTSLPKNQDKWRAAETYCQQRGWRFVVMTEKRINQLKKKAIQERRSGG